MKTFLSHLTWFIPALLLTHLSSAENPTQPQKPVQTTSGIELVYIPEGDFYLGSTADERTWAIKDEQSPSDHINVEGDTPRPTRILNGFWLGRTEVTVGQWRHFVADTGCVTDVEKIGDAVAFDWEKKKFGNVKGANWRDPKFGFSIHDNDAVTCISWRDAVAFCDWLNKKEHALLPDGCQFRLPTEAEWEYACRGGDSRARFWWGNDPDDGRGRLNAASNDILSETLPVVPHSRFSWSDGHAWIAPVDVFGNQGRNQFGLADMLGNAAEWCLDAFDPNGTHEAAYLDEQQPRRVLRGGSFPFGPGETRCASREVLRAGYARCDTGFRVCIGKSPERVSAAIPEAEFIIHANEATLRKTDELVRDAVKQMDEQKKWMKIFADPNNPLNDPALKAKMASEAARRQAMEIGAILAHGKASAPADTNKPMEGK